MSSSLAEELRRAAAEVDLPLDSRVVDACALHFSLLERWNRVHNLTRITDPRDAARKHYADCLVGLAALSASERVLDAGAGAGFPGILAALVWPESRIVLVEPARKRASFLEKVTVELGLLNVEVRQQRIEAASPAPLVLSRATFPWSELRSLHPAVQAGGRMAAWAGREPVNELWQAELARWGWSGYRQELRVPGVEHRALLIATRPVADR